MRRFGLSMCCLVGICLGLPHASAPAAEMAPDVLVPQLTDQSDPIASRAAFLELRRLLRSAAPEIVCLIQDALCQRITALDDVGAIRRMCLALAVAPRDDAITAVAEKLGPGVPHAAQLSLCVSLRYLVSYYPPSHEGTTALALSRLQWVLQQEKLPLPVADAAVMAAARFGASGFDFLMQLRSEPVMSGRIDSVFWTALSETGDPRALPILRAGIADQKTRSGARIQAVHALGHALAGLSRDGRSVDAAEWVACADLLQQYLRDDTPDQLFSVALQARSEIVDVRADAELYQVTFAALASGNPFRREAALQVLYRSEITPDEHLREVVRSIAEDAPEQAVRAAAQALLEKHDAHLPPSPP